ncbi:endolytic transglycosylase MltG [Vibrio cincinnatiensis]|uniref:endolytic transglycosylase MltG n=1 Tax=Vibrio cincinnatiensis TaxID=675 RepID=UPI001EE10979|nr:endolytic transglycosylase MltG [Vibrio cincinnatiensis]
MIKKLLAILLILLLFTLSCYVYIVKQVDNYLDQNLSIHELQLITIQSGASLNGTLSLLVNNGYIQEHFATKLLRRLHPELTQVKAGTYQLTPGMSLKKALALFISGREFQFSITFVEGSRFNDWREILASTPELRQTINTLSESEIAQKIGVDNQKLEGLFLAETYHFTKGELDVDILKRAHRKLQQTLTKAWDQRQPDLPLASPYEVLILASIIEKETAIDSERKRVASVFINRLNKRMRLQTDPTVIYGMGERYDGRIRKADLREVTPYNTYVINGLPPTPIAMAGEASIYAAINPEQSDYLYFVASGRGDHVFSKTLTEHNRAVRAYLRQLRNQQ